jgi:hypothetical protein
VVLVVERDNQVLLEVQVEAVEVFLLDLLQQVVQELLIKVLLEEQVQLVLHKMVVVVEVALVQ